MSEQELRIDGATRIYGILGHPVRSSLSPAMHNAAFRALGINAAYVPFPVSPEHFPEVVRALLLAGVSGFNLTVPHKIAILPLLADITPEARAIGAVNTVRCENGSMAATNTDAEGFRLSLERDLAWQPAGKRVLLLGAGGAARAIAFSLLQAGLGELGIANRTPARAEALAADCRLAQAGAKVPAQPGTKVGALELGATAGWAPDLLVNATSVGMGDGKKPVELAGLKVREAVLDIVYTPAETPLLAEAARLGIARTNGLGMLLYQGALAFRFWTGQEAPLEVMRAALEGGLEARKILSGAGEYWDSVREGKSNEVASVFLLVPVWPGGNFRTGNAHCICSPIFQISRGDCSHRWSCRRLASLWGKPRGNPLFPADSD